MVGFNNVYYTIYIVILGLIIGLSIIIILNVYIYIWEFNLLYYIALIAQW